jgi:exosome complex RNA-binding protein Rrp42 (RNase PH superfamily)
MVDRSKFVGDLEVNHRPIEITVSKIGSNLIVDAEMEEEKGIDASLTVAVREDDMVVALQKQGAKGMTMDEAKKMIEIAIKKSKDLRKTLDNAVKG